jgi:hypothetical protein
MSKHDKDDCGCKKNDDFKPGRRDDDFGDEKHNDNCDCCCVEGIKDQLKDARKSEVLIYLTNDRTVRGFVKKVNCDVVVLESVTDPVLPKFDADYAVVSLCEITAFFVNRR